jgi:hypothetical protein
MKRKPPDSRNALSALRLSLAVTLATLIPLLLYGSAPSWWSTRGVLVEQGVADDYAPANQGQLKNIAKAAVLEMDAKLPGGAGDALHQLVATWSNPSSQTNDFAPLNLGQLKNVAKPFYDRLISTGLATEYPWPNSSNAADDFAVANIGQIKRLFSFELPAVDPLYDGDQNGLPDAWERQYFGATGVDPNADPDGDGTSNLQEYLNHADPTDFFNGTLIGLAITGGGDQRGDPGTLLPVPVSVRVSSLYLSGVYNAPVTVMIAQGGARLVANNADPSVSSDSMTLRANAYDNDGYPVAQFYVLLPSSPDVSIIRASTHGGSQSVSASTTAVTVDSSLGVPTNLTVTVTSTSTAQLTWTVTNSSPTTLQASVDGGKTWVTLGTVAQGLTSAAVTGLTPGQKTKFRVFSGGTPSDPNNSSFRLPDPSSGPPPPPPSGGGGASDSVDAVPLAAPVMEVDQAEFYYIRVGGYLGMSNQPKWYKNKQIVIVNDFRDSDGTQVAFGSTTQTFTWIPGHESYGRGGREVTSTTTTGGGAGLLVPYDTVIWTDSVLRMESSGLLFGSTSSKTITLTNPFTDADAETAGAEANLEFYGEFYEPDRSAYDAFFSHGGGHYSIVVTKYRFRVNADPNAVVTWDVQFTPENGGPVQHDFQSWHGDGSTHSPEYLLDPRHLNHGQNGSYKILVISGELMVDGNRDGEMSFEDPNVHDADRTTAERPYRFWVNDDDDGAGGDPGEHIPPSAPDYADGRINSIRDLEDFARLHVNVAGLEESLKSGSIKAAFEWRGTSNSPRIKIYRAPFGGREYLTSESQAASTLLFPFRDTLGEVIPGTRLFMSQDFWVSTSHISNVPTTLPIAWFLFEASGEGKGLLVLSFWSEGRRISETPGVWLDLKDVKQMYQRAIATPDSLTPPYESNESTFNDRDVSYMPDVTPRFEPPVNEERQCLVFVHGWKATEADAANAGQTMYKRLWWQGFNGRFATFRWPTYTSAFSYNSSEWRAWKYGKSLGDYITKYVRQQLPDYSITIAAHSMGNVVTASALTGGMTLNKYLLMQAAIPAGCYDDAVNNYQRFLTAETSRPTPDTTTEKGYRLFLQMAKGHVGSFVSFFNTDDFALAKGTIGLVPGWPFEVNWEKNEVDYKPDSIGAGYYKYQGNGVSYFTMPHANIRLVEDVHESLAFVARPRSKAAGAEPRNATVFGSVVDLQAVCGFGADVDDHSGQFTRPIQQLTPFYKRMAEELKQ